MISSKQYYAKPQGHAAYLRVKGAETSVIKNMMEANISIKEIQILYPKLKITPDVFFTKTIDQGREDKKVNFNIINFTSDECWNVINTNIKDYENNLSGKWAFYYYKQINSAEDSLIALFIKEEFNALANANLNNLKKMTADFPEYLSIPLHKTMEEIRINDKL